jgi:hypothetical protein
VLDLAGEDVEESLVEPMRVVPDAEPLLDDRVVDRDERAKLHELDVGSDALDCDEAGHAEVLGAEPVESVGGNDLEVGIGVGEHVVPAR